MPYTAQCVLALEVQEASPFTTGTRATAYRTATAKLTGVDRRHQQTYQISANLSSVEIPVAPLGSAMPSNAFLWLQTDHPVELRLGAASHAPLSGVQLMILHAAISGLFITTSDFATILVTELLGGSNAAVTVSPPQP